MCAQTCTHISGLGSASALLIPNEARPAAWALTRKGPDGWTAHVSISEPGPSSPPDSEGSQTQRLSHLAPLTLSAAAT